MPPTRSTASKSAFDGYQVFCKDDVPSMHPLSVAWWKFSYPPQQFEHNHTVYWSSWHFSGTPDNDPPVSVMSVATASFGTVTGNVAGTPDKYFPVSVSVATASINWSSLLSSTTSSLLLSVWKSLFLYNTSSCSNSKFKRFTTIVLKILWLKAKSHCHTWNPSPSFSFCRIHTMSTET